MKRPSTKPFLSSPAVKERGDYVRDDVAATRGPEPACVQSTQPELKLRKATSITRFDNYYRFQLPAYTTPFCT